MKELEKKMKEVGKSDEEVATFKKEAQEGAKKIVGKFKDYEFFRGASMDAETYMYVLIDYREDGITPYATYWKNGFKETKV